MSKAFLFDFIIMTLSWFFAFDTITILLFLILIRVIVFNTMPMFILALIHIVDVIRDALGARQ